ncbi:amidohydrolase family protein [Brevibacterium samyangense]|uniref:Amidohydrolase family protein n=1 Tax=Brevibacterium samyangense TaxID=366888 RepID=A0ABN2T836_9MICO
MSAPAGTTPIDNTAATRATPTTARTVEYQAPWIIAFQDGGHRLLRDGAVVVAGTEIVHVGARDTFGADEVVRTRNIIAPGFISMHAHMQESPADKNVAEDFPKRSFYSSNLFEILPARSKALTIDDAHTCARVSVAEHLRTGTTTVMQMGNEAAYIAELCEEVGMRAYVSQSYRTGPWYTDNGRTVEYDFSGDGGAAAFEQAVSFALDHVNADNSALVTGFLNPSQVDTVTEELFRESRAVADAHGLMLQTHAAQSMNEFLEMTRRHGRTPIEWLADIGYLGERAIIGHGLFVTGSSWTNYAGDDIGLLADSGTSVAYNPWVFARNGIVMETFDRYRERGVPVTLGTDTTTQSMLHSTRWCSVITKVLEHNANAGNASATFDAATIVAADVLGRPDLGRIAAGAKADLCFWRSDSHFMTPLRDPIRAIVYYAEAEDLEKVMVNGRFVMEDGAVAGLDTVKDLELLQTAAETMWANWQDVDWAGAPIDERVPMSFPAFTL